MSPHLLLLSIGPVQQFIAQARRTRDLWFGSHVLSEVCKAAARALAHSPGTTLVFPALDRDAPELEQSDDPYDHGVPVYNVANKILALVTGAPRTVADRARAAAQTRFVDWGLFIFDTRSQLVESDMRESALEQLDTFLEIYALWTPCHPERPDEYRYRRAQLEAELLARKTLHDFGPWCAQIGGVQKSSLDGARESVLKQNRGNDASWRRYHIGKREQLDAIGLLKRTGGRPEQFVPIPTIGLLPWLERARQRAPEQFAELKKQCKKLGLQPVRRKERWYQLFPFDAQLFLPERWRPYLSEQPERTIEPEKFGADYITPILARAGEPYPYVACIVADGDRMGATLDALAGAGLKVHRDVSRLLARFAAEARRILEQEHHGVLVYAGGDDVLGFVAVHNAIRCATQLRQVFQTVVGQALDGRDAPIPTLSVGVGIGHILQSLGTLLDLGRTAEKSAKLAGRNRLAVVLEKHSGSRRRWTWPWPGGDRRDSPQQLLENAMCCLQEGHVSHKKVHEIDALLRRTPGDHVDDPARWARFLRHEVRRVLMRTGAGLAPTTAPTTDGRILDDMKLDPNSSLDVLRADLHAWVNRMLIARELARASCMVVANRAEERTPRTKAGYP